MSWTLRSLAIIFLICCLWHSSQAETCDTARSSLQNLLSIGEEEAQSMTYSSLKETSNNCRIESTCCKSTTETTLKNSVSTSYQNAILNTLKSTINPCLRPPIQNTTNDFIDNSKATLIATLAIISLNAFSGHKDIFDEFYNYLKDGVSSLDLCDLETHFQTLFFSVYLTSFTESLERFEGLQLVTTKSTRTCIYNIFINDYGTQLTTDFSRMQERYNLYLRYLWAQKVGDQALKSVLTHTLSSDCKNSILRLLRCSHCADVSQTSVCRSFCQNTLRGCLVDTTEFGSVYEEYNDMMKKAKERVIEYNPFLVVNLVADQLTNLVFEVVNDRSNIKTKVDSACSPTYNQLRRRRSVSNPIKHSLIKRQSPSAVESTLDDALSCSSDIVDVLNELPDTVCENEDDVLERDYTCWNGTTVNSYCYTVPDSDRLSQLSNPELYIRSTTGLLYKNAISKLKSVSSDLSNCENNVRGCEIKMCNIPIPTGSEYDFGDDLQFQSFSQTGLPEPVFVSVKPVDPSMTSDLSTTTSILTTTSDVHTTSSSNAVSIISHSSVIFRDTSLSLSLVMTPTFTYVTSLPSTSVTRESTTYSTSGTSLSTTSSTSVPRESTTSSTSVTRESTTSSTSVTRESTTSSTSGTSLSTTSSTSHTPVTTPTTSSTVVTLSRSRPIPTRESTSTFMRSTSRNPTATPDTIDGDEKPDPDKLKSGSSGIISATILVTVSLVLSIAVIL